MIIKKQEFKNHLVDLKNILKDIKRDEDFNGYRDDMLKIINNDIVALENKIDLFDNLKYTIVSYY